MNTARKASTVRHYRTKASIAKTYCVSEATAGRWISDPGFPKRVSAGWQIAKVTAWMAERTKRKAARAAAAGDKQEKVRLECERLRVVVLREQELLKQAEIETSRQQKELIKRSDAVTRLQSLSATCRGIVESWRQHEVVKNPSAKAQIEALADRLCEAMRDGLGK